MLLSLYIGRYMEILILLSMLFIHEIGHFFIMIITRQKVESLTLTIFGGSIKANIGGSKLVQIAVYLGGVIFNLVAYLILINFEGQYIEVACHYSLLLASFNLLPIYPLDGFNVLESSFVFKNYESKNIKTIFYISIFCLVVFLVIACYFKSLGLILIGLYLAYKNYQYNLNKEEVIIKKIIYNLK